MNTFRKSAANSLTSLGRLIKQLKQSSRPCFQVPVNRLNFQLKGIDCSSATVDKFYFLKDTVITKSSFVLEGVRGLSDLQLANKKLVDSTNATIKLAAFNESSASPLGLLNWNLLGTCVRKEKITPLKLDNVSCHHSYFLYCKPTIIASGSWILLSSHVQYLIKRFQINAVINGSMSTIW